ncbi:MAG: hypothetical protein IKH75_01405 [Ruminococcus sp.]|nr:hypothetical protein [Ruminococcus sp.]
MKIKDRIVKWLGGYTKDEYKFIASKPVQFKIETRTINTIACRKILPFELVANDLNYEKFAKEDVVREILKKLTDEGYVRFSSEEDHGSIVLQGKLDVVRRYYD